MAYKGYLRFKCLIIILPKYVFLLWMRSFSCNILKLIAYFIYKRNNSYGPDVVWPYGLKINKKKLIGKNKTKTHSFLIYPVFILYQLETPLQFVFTMRQDNGPQFCYPASFSRVLVLQVCHHRNQPETNGIQHWPGYCLVGRPIHS